MKGHRPHLTWLTQYANADLMFCDICTDDDDLVATSKPIWIHQHHRGSEWHFQDIGLIPYLSLPNDCESTSLGSQRQHWGINALKAYEKFSPLFTWAAAPSST